MSDEIKLYFFQTGRIRQKEVNIKLGAGQGEFFTPIPWFQITHPRGNVVIDGGIAVEAALDPKGHWGAVADVYYPFMDPEEGCMNRLKEAGFDPADVKYVIHSHLHLDHTGAIGNFRHRRLLIAALDKKIQCGSAQSPHGIGFPASHQGFSKC